MIATDSFPRHRNHLLAALPDSALHTLLPDLEWVEMPSGQTLHDAGVPLDHVYFPVSAIVSVVSTMRDGAAIEAASVGFEGMVGLEAFLLAPQGASHGSALVQFAGHGWRMEAKALARHGERSAPVARLLMRYAQALMAHMAQIAACNRHHTLDQQLCRWLLAQLDRGAGREMRLTHEGIARMLGVRREGITGSALKLQKAGVLHCSRGKIEVLERAGLQARSCECHAALRQAYGGLWGAAGPGGPALGRRGSRQGRGMTRSSD